MCIILVQHLIVLSGGDCMSAWYCIASWILSTLLDLCNGCPLISVVCPGNLHWSLNVMREVLCSVFRAGHSTWWCSCWQEIIRECEPISGFMVCIDVGLNLIFFVAYLCLLCVQQSTSQLALTYITSKNDLEIDYFVLL